MSPDVLDGQRGGRMPILVAVSLAVVGVGLIVFVLVGGVAAGAPSETLDIQGGTHEALQESLEICGQSTQPLVTSYNDQITEVPWFLRAAVRGTVIHGVVHDDVVGDYTFETDADGSIGTVAAGAPASPRVRVITDCESFLRIRSANDPVDVFWSEYRNDRVRIVGIGFANWLLFAVLKHPYLTAGLSLLLLLLAVGGGYYYVRRRRRSRRRFLPEDGGGE